ncbi:unnamed protein product [Linum trigynum]|uniref:Reverse transcriptase domain-containing protein n=1 Tax=Linum trigynum TaxID=586398 RepID=A0AAV2EC44_9ROSI
MLNRAAARKVLSFHPQCQRIGLTHLCFADDLLIFTKGSEEAVGTVATILEKFYLVSGLRCNPSKSEIFCAGVNEEVKKTLVNCFGFKEGTLPVMYLGIPLSAGKLKAVDCKALVEKITSRIRGWQPKLLTYARKIQLIVAVLASISQYRMNIIQLPKKVIKEVESMCSKFLWSNMEQNKKAKVAWKHAAFPKEEGGLGFRDLWSWNQACLARHIWVVLANQETLWIAWLKEYWLRNISIWETQIRGSWVWNKILKTRPLLNSSLVCTEAGVEWNGAVMTRFSIKTVWDSLRPRRETVPWASLVWKGPLIPKNSLITWLVIQDRITTLDKVKKWNPDVLDICPLCHSDPETRDHLFFSCSYVRTVWSIVFDPWQISLGWTFQSGVLAAVTRLGDTPKHNT